MERSPQMYEEGSPNEKDFTNSMFTYSDDNDHSSNLDPALENIVDLQELINSATAFETEEGIINIENIFAANNLEFLDNHTPHVNTPASSVANDLDITKLVSETVQHVCMTNSEEASYHKKGSEGPQIIIIKAEDLSIATNEATRPGRSRLSTCSGDSYSSWSTHSSRCNSPSVPGSIVYECRKPGRKPSANGPIRPRKREPAKDTTEYFEKRARNNVAVRKSREKAKLRQDVTEKRVADLQCENERLQKKVDLLSKELHVLKSLFVNVGASLPDNFEEIISR